MKQYKPEYLGKVLPADNPSDMKKLLTNQYDAFSKIYDTCKGESEKIGDIKIVGPSEGDSDDTLKLKVSADKTSVDKITENAQKDGSVTVQNDVITAKGNTPNKDKK